MTHSAFIATGLALGALASTAASAESYCREFTSKANIGGNVQQTVGTACQQADGSWAIQPGEQAGVVPARASIYYNSGGYVASPAPVYVAPPVYAAPPVYYSQPPVYAQQPYYAQPVYQAPVYAAPVYAAPPVYETPGTLALGIDIGGHNHGNWRPGYGGYGGGNGYGHRW